MRRNRAVSAAEFRALAGMPPAQPKRAHKYNAKRTEYAGRVYASRAEADYARLLDESADVIGWLPQVALPLPGGVRYVVDFLVWTRDGRSHAAEVKGVATAAWKIKIRQAREIYPWLPIVVVRRKGNAFVNAEEEA